VESDEPNIEQSLQPGLSGRQTLYVFLSRDSEYIYCYSRLTALAFERASVWFL